MSPKESIEPKQKDRRASQRRFSPLLTDLYQLTMAQGYWLKGMQNRGAVFHLFFRQNPFGGGFTVVCGIEDAIQYVLDCWFTEEELTYLASLQGNDGRPLFRESFLEFLAQFRFRGHIYGVREGTVVFPHEPLLRVEGGLLECQLLETGLLNLIGFPTLVATKAARVCLAAGGDPVVEFGLRRAQGVNGAMSATRAAYIGGCVATSNVLAGKEFGIPVRGTHAHSWVQAFGDELTAFRAFAEAMPNNCVLLVDTYNTLEGVQRAIQVAKELKAKGGRLVAIRLDSGDLAWLSRQARRMLDEAGLQEVRIMASNDLDEYIIASLKEQKAAIDLWGVGTRLVTAFDQPALGCVYKLGMIEEADGRWRPCLKLSEESAKVTIPGRQQVRRFLQDGEYIADAIYDVNRPPIGSWHIVDPADPIRRKRIPDEAEGRDLLHPLVQEGQRVVEPEPLEHIRERCRTELARFHEGIKRFVYPHRYPAGVERGLFELRQQLIEELRGNHPSESVEQLP